jgi:hypothetical protein
VDLMTQELGIVLSALAVFGLITRSHFVGACTGGGTIGLFNLKVF